jgi:radical SAM protein (TIGR01212 family)
LEYINRGHDFENVVKAINLTHDYGIKVGGHIIFGLPGETREMMLNETKILNELPLDTIKFHQLQIITNTIMAVDYNKHPEKYNLFELDEYIDFIVEFVEKLNPNFVIERFAGEVPPRFLAGPSWGKIRNDQILNKIEQQFKDRNTWQGKFYI